MKKIQHLLDLVGKISKKNAEILDATGGRFNMFRVCGVNHYENTHSAIIAEFLNPKGSHGLKSKLLECFIETLGDKFTIQNFDCESAQVITEYSTTGEGRIDLFIKDKQEKVIIIENKIYAGDQPEQLKRYNRYADKYKQGSQILYLTLDGSEASEQSSDGVDYLPISFAETIIDWLEKCVAAASRFPMVRETIIQYINHLKQLTNQDMNAENEKEVVDVLINNLKAAQAIAQNYPQVFETLAKKHFSPKMEEFAKEKGLVYHYERSEERYVRFYLKNPLWQDKCWIGFTFENGSGCYYGLCNNPQNQISEENKNTVHERMKVPGKRSQWWAFYAFYPNQSIESWISDIVESDKFFEDCKEKIENLLSATEGLTM